MMDLASAHLEMRKDYAIVGDEKTCRWRAGYAVAITDVVELLSGERRKLLLGLRDGEDPERVVAVKVIDAIVRRLHAMRAERRGRFLGA